MQQNDSPKKTDQTLEQQQPLPSGWRGRAHALVTDSRFERSIMVIIAINAVILGLETSAEIMASAGGLLKTLDRIILAIFVIELLLRLTAFGTRFFRDPWSLFDLVVVVIALIPASGPFAVLRALRALRALRLISAAPRMRRVVQALLSAIPGMGSIFALLALLFYVGSVIATNLFGTAYDEWFGSLWRSMFSLFQIMTLESWSMGIVRPVMESHPFAWAFFVPFILLTTFVMLNLFIAVIVNAMHSQHETDEQADRAAIADAAHDERTVILAELKQLRTEIAALRHAVSTGKAGEEGAGTTSK